MSHSISTDVKVIQHINPVSQAAATVNGPGVDASGFNTAEFLINLGVIAAGQTVDAKAQESDDNSTWSDVTGAAIAQVPDTGDDTVKTIELRSLAGGKKFLRAQVVVAGAGATLLAVTLLLGRAHGTQAMPVQTPTVAV